ncbi:MAG: hypothetical protein JXL84_00870, partial [Deltaproteobacteria bacterium]|nr:hypothetical protein [Deltaproteobacteria bacterium]
MGFLESHFEQSQYPDRERQEVAEVRLTILNRLMHIFLFAGLPAMLFGVIRSYTQGRWGSSIIYLSFYLLFLVATLESRRLAFRTRALILVFSLFLMGLTSLVTVGMSGSGVQMMLGVCILVALLFGFRGGMLAMMLTFVCISVVATAMTTGFIDISPARMMTSRSAVPWLTAICIFLMIVSVTVIGFQMFSSRIQESLEMLEESKRELEARNRDLTREIQERERAQEILKESEEKFRSLVETTSDWIWETGADG